MLTYNFDKIFKARGIDKPFTFLMKAGFSNTLASRVKNNRVKRLESKELERLCLALKCAPNDLMEWEPDEGYENDTTQPLNKLRKGYGFDLVKSINSLPYDKMKVVNEMIQRELES